MDIYSTCPTWESEQFIVRLLREEDCDDLLKVYSDKNALPFFNSDKSVFVNGSIETFSNKKR